MIKAIKILSAAILGTSAMTAFSYAMAAKKQEKFEEPVLLNKLIRRIMPVNKLKPDNEGLPGWMLHYGVGLLFSAAFDQVWRKGKVKPDLPNALWLGGLAGLIGIGTWKSTYKVHPNPPEDIDLKSYYGQLIVAHLIFGATAAFGYRLIQKPTDHSGSTNDSRMNTKKGNTLLDEPEREGALITD
ncbi:hypothetical protein GCM10009122_33420 [Fulvivirga kasyanovii]|uniref:DUF1440 domain-containing protein n=1 Tax=Fulvivirga kasyanovii TaxID=396812 RepID=A0ABW9RN81_9BACT|nr:hypothetical protein [Fulvivirga kasyanovii]MTI25371.1 hypothetical protein [Fulvivirga kasyanovii]